MVGIQFIPFGSLVLRVSILRGGGACMQCTDIHAGRSSMHIIQNERGVDGNNFKMWVLVGSDQYPSLMTTPVCLEDWISSVETE